MSATVPPLAIFLHGPIGSGKTTLGRALARHLGVPFIDGDEFADQEVPWLRCILRTSRAIAAAGAEALTRHPAVVIGYPLRRREWLFHQRRFEQVGAATLFVGLVAQIDALIAASRGRALSRAELARAAEMLAEGYGARQFSDAVIDTGVTSLAGTLAVVERLIAGLTCR